MANHSANIIKGLRYEVGSLPNFIAESPAFWGLPHGIRRRIYFALGRKHKAHVADMRTRLPENVNNSTLRPFIETQSVFVHIPKAAGLAVSFGMYGRKTGDHRTVCDYKLCFTEGEFDSFFKYAFVRNPWDRLVSAFHYLKPGGRNKQDAEWADAHLSPYDNVSDFVVGWLSEANADSALHFRPQHTFVCCPGGGLEVNLIARYESIAEDYDAIRSILKTGSDLPATNVTRERPKDYRTEYTDRAAEIVQRVYAKDIELFGYAFDPGIPAMTAEGSVA